MLPRAWSQPGRETVLKPAVSSRATAALRRGERQKEREGGHKCIYLPRLRHREAADSCRGWPWRRALLLLLFLSLLPLLLSRGQSCASVTSCTAARLGGFSRRLPRSASEVVGKGCDKPCQSRDQRLEGSRQGGRRGGRRWGWTEQWPRTCSHWSSLTLSLYYTNMRLTLTGQLGEAIRSRE
ncbi:hypothetical protein GGR56DRAFT_651567 [Xylariaceae sp. FL0804]|nr:hypothetical protein GGR56DRAFT_651567 [Xylariaceae sp. FL0804]